VDVGDWSIRSWRLISGLMSLGLAAISGLTGFASDYNGIFPALGGPNGLLYDLTLKISQPWRRNVPTLPAVFVAIDDASLADPQLAALPRALFQPVWARLIDGLAGAEAHRIAFDVVFAYSGADFRVDSFSLPDYDRSLVDALVRHRDRIVLGRFPSVAPATAFGRAVGASRIGVLDLQVESDGRIRSVAPLVRLSDGRIAFGFAALGAGLGIRQASSAQRLLITPHAPLADIPTYRLATLLSCLSSSEGAAQIRRAVEGRIVVIGTAVLGEDEHRGPTRFLGHASRTSPDDRCAPHQGLIVRPEPDSAAGALIQIAAIQSAASERPIRLAMPWLRTISAACLGLVFAVLAFRDKGALTIGEYGASPRSTVLVQLIRSLAIGFAGPAVVGLLLAAAAFTLADLWLPMGFPILAANLAFGTVLAMRSVRHAAFFRRLYRTAGRYLPPARLVTLARTGFADPGEGQEREVSILLADLVGFTSFSNNPARSASEVVRIANDYFSLMQAAIDRRDGCSDKFLGDAVLAFWNGLSDEPEHAIKALATAWEIVGAVGNSEVFHKNRLGIRAVVCSGRVYVGDLGAKQRSNFTIIGPAVNETFRLEKFPGLYGLPLLVAASTAEMIRGSNSSAASEMLASGALVRLDDVELKGFDAARSIYAFVPRDDPGLADFEAGRKALDRQRICDALAHLRSIDSGMLQQAANVILARYRTCP
jgi:class 3 adenylate cyclase